MIGTAPERDLAVIRVQATDLVPLRVGRSSTLRLGDAVFAVGFPLGLGGPSVTSGIVSGLDRTIDGPNGELKGLLQTDAAINPGNSGGALVDRFGRLIGINTAVVRLAEAQNVGFAIAIDGAAAGHRATPKRDAGDRRVARHLVRLGRLRRSRGAARPRGLRARRRRHRRLSRRPGEEAELAVGDVIIAADDVPIDSAADLSKLLADRNPGDELDLELIDSRGPRLVAVAVVRRDLP